jgi:type I restriction enzyme S subunit
VTRIESISAGRIDDEKVGHVQWSPGLESFRLREGDILLSHINSLPMVGNCALFNSGRPLYSGMNLLRIQPTPTVYAPWLWRVISSDGVRKEISARAKPAINQASVTTTQIKALQLPVPPVPEQRAIADFLDRETARLDTLVGKKRELIEKLKEKRAALITRAVMRGLDENALLRNSGIEWLGQIPRSWRITRLRHLIKGSLVNGLFKTLPYFGSGTRLINVFDAYRNDFLVDEQSLERVETTPAEVKNYAVNHGDILFVRSSLKLEGVGRSVCCLNPFEDVVFECHLVRARPDTRQIDPVFLIAFLNSTFGTQFLISRANMVTMATLGQPKLLDLPVLVPPTDAQYKITDYIKCETAKLDRMIEKVEAAIERLQEYRTALITAAVTGKIDLRKNTK